MPMAHERAVRRQAQVSLTMELVPTTDEQLRHLAEDDPHLGPHFAGVFASDRLPRLPIRDRAQGYIVNVDLRIVPAVIGWLSGRRPRRRRRGGGVRRAW